MINFFVILFLIFSQHQQISPTVAEYEEKLEHVEKMSKGVFENDTWISIFLKNKKDEKEKTWGQLNEYEKDMFMFVVGNRTLNSIMKIEEFWNEEIKKFDNPNFKLVPSPQSRPATKKEVANYLEKLEKNRKQFVLELEKYNNHFFEKYKNELSLEEIAAYKKRIGGAK